MDYRVADDEQVIEALEAVLHRHRTIESQAELGRLVRDALGDEEGVDLRASDARIRRIAVDRGLVEVQVRTGTTTEPAREACPVCGEPLEQVHNLTLDGERTVVATRCPACPYRSGLRHEVPLRYAFEAANGPEEERVGPF